MPSPQRNASVQVSHLFLTLCRTIKLLYRNPLYTHILCFSMLINAGDI